jgi:hypothetical protein
MEERLLERIGPPSDDVLERLERFVAKRQQGDVSSVDELLQRFSAEEDKQRLRDRATHGLMRGALPVLAAATIASLFIRPYGVLHYILWGLTLVALPFAVLGMRRGPQQYLGKTELAVRETC